MYALQETAERVMSAREDSGKKSPVVLSAWSLRKSFGGQVVLDGTNLELRQGEVVLLRGENGSGKTTLLNILTGNLEPDAGDIHYLADSTPRTYHFPRRWWQELNPFDHFTPEFVALEGIGRTWQDVRLFSAQTLRDNIAVAHPTQPGENPLAALFQRKRVRFREEQIRTNADAMLARFGLLGREDSSADRISLGQSKRVAIARAIAAGAKILFLDEPLAGLDHQGIADVLELLRTLVYEHTVTLVIVEHIFNLHHLQQFATTDWLLQGGRITVSRASEADGGGTSSSSFHITKESQPNWLSCLVPEGAEIIDEPLPNGAQLTRIRPRGFSEIESEPVLEVKNLVVRRGTRLIDWSNDGPGSSGLNLTVHKGELVLLQAPNGWGKTSLLEAIAGLLSPLSGAIRLQGENLAHLTPWQRSTAGLCLIQAADNVFPSLTADENLRLARVSNVPGRIAAFHGKPVERLSGGQRQQVALAGFRSTDCTRVFLFDEPFSMLDQEAMTALQAALRPNPRYGILISLPATSPE